MPGFLTHYLFGQQIISKLDLITDCSWFKKVLNRHPHVFNLGTQGPDLFFYYLPSNFNPKKKLGSVMHQTKTGAYFSCCLDYLCKPLNKDTKEIFTAYLAGMICHYALDMNAHPFIYARTGYDVRTPGGLTYLATHCQYESNLDSLMFQQLKHRLPSSFDASHCIRLTRLETHTLARCLADTISTTFFPEQSHPYTTRGFMTRAMRHMPAKVRFLHDTGGIKRPLVEWLELKTIRAHILSCLFTIDEIKHPAYLINQDRNPWHNPWDPSKYYSSTFLDLYLEALRYTALCLGSLSQLLDSFSILSRHYGEWEKYKEELKKLLGSCSYNSGLTIP